MPQLPALQASATETIANPFIWSDVPDDDIIRVGDTYYMVSTTMFFTPGVPIMKSTDLFSWEICGYVYDTYADGDVQNLTNGKNDYAHGQWATSLRYDNGTFYVFFGSYGTGKSYIYKTKDIESGSWTRTELNGMYHDASMLFDTDGRKYLVYGGGGEIKIKEFNSDMTGFKSGGADKTLFKTGLSGLAGEGSHVHKIGDYYYVFVIAWPNGHGRLELCYRSKSLLGTYEGKTVLESGLGTYGSGVAQGGVIQTTDGDWYALLFQDHGSVGRIPVLVPMTWQNDWPVLGVNGKAPVTLEVPDGYKGTSLAKDDEFDYSSNKLQLEWQWNHNPDNSAWSVTDRPGYLRLYNKSTANELLHARNTLTMRTEGPSCSGIAKLDTSHMKAGDYAGLSAFQLNYGNVGVYVTDSGAKKIYMAKNGGNEVANSSNKIIEEVNLSGDEIYLKIDYNYNTVDSNFNVSNNIDKANFYYSYNGSDWKKIGDTLSMTYDLKLFTGYRNALYSYPTKSTGGYADFDAFYYERADWNVPTYTEPDPNGYLFHYTFEKNAESFTGRGSASVAATSAEAYEGSKSLLCSGREASWNGAVHNLSSFTFKPGEAYSFSTAVKYTDGPDTTTFHFTLQYTGSDGEVHYDKISTENAVKGEWVQLSNTAYTIPAGASEMQIYVETDSGTHSFYVDDMIAAPKGQEIDGPGVSSFRLGDVNSDGVINAIDLSLAKIGFRKEAFSSKIAELAADVDQNGTVTEADILWIQQYVLGVTDEYPEKAEPIRTPSSYEYNPSVTYHEFPGNYTSAASKAGKVVQENYTGINGAKTMYVYLPPEYDASKKYNVFYLMHGGGENEKTCFFDSSTQFQNIFDHMIAAGELEPLIVVTPTFNNCPDGAGDVWKEMRETIVPYVEGKYSTYANKNTSISNLQKTRYHRGYGGFSMGGGSTWNTFINDLDIFAYFMPLSGHCWGGVSALTGAIDKLGLKPDEYFIFAATGTEDIAYGNMVPQINQMKNDSHFIYTSDFSQGNFYFLEGPSKTHWWGFVRHYVYAGLPSFFHEHQND